MVYYSQQINFTTMKKSLSALKEKFGKFEISKEQANKITGGWCYRIKNGEHILYMNESPCAGCGSYCSPAV